MTWFSQPARWLVAVTWIVSGVGLATATTLEMKSVWFMPPTPSGGPISYGPSRVPGASPIGGDFTADVWRTSRGISPVGARRRFTR